MTTIKVSESVSIIFRPSFNAAGGNDVSPILEGFMGRVIFDNNKLSIVSAIPSKQAEADVLAGKVDPKVFSDSYLAAKSNVRAKGEDIWMNGLGYEYTEND